MHDQHLVECPCQSFPHVRLKYESEECDGTEMITNLRHLNDVKEEWKDVPFMVKMYGPHNESAVVGRGPRIGGEMDMARVFLYE